MPDLSLVEFIALTTRAAIEIEHGAEAALKRAARLIEREAKAEIGTYQAEAGPYAAWAELADATKADRLRKGFTENDPLLRTGELRDSIDHRVEGREAAVGSDSEIAVYQELGTSKIPPRSFLGGAAERKAEEVANLIGHGAVRGLIGRGA